MSRLKVNRIKSYLDKTFSGKIDIEDLKKRPQEEIQRNLLSRALAAFSLVILADTSIEEACSAITDGYDDNGLDAILFDSKSKNLWLVQSKLTESGTGGIDNGDVEKYTKGVKLLIDGDLSRFNKKVKEKQDEILEALDDPAVKIQLLFAYTGRELSKHNKHSIEDLLKDENDTDEILVFNDFNIDKIYKALETGIASTPINEDVFISNWGHIDEPLKAYYGQINGTDLGTLWQKYGRKLFTDNIRNFLGDSAVNEEITKTIKTEPENFIYFNNGITILCTQIRKKPIGGSDKAVGAFSCEGMSVVNGAQTLGSIGSLAESESLKIGKIKVLVKFISLEGSPEGLGNRITIATNTQNKVEKKDFVSLDSQQHRLKIELKLEGIDYHFKRTDEKVIPDEKNFILEEVAFSLAALWSNVDYSTMVKKESGRLWDDVTSDPYTDLFNDNISAQKVIKAVRIYRFIEEKMKQLADETDGRERSIYRYGNSFVAHIVFQKMPKQLWSDSSAEFEKYFLNDLVDLVSETIDELYNTIEQVYFDSMIVYVLRNYTKCRDLASRMG